MATRTRISGLENVLLCEDGSLPPLRASDLINFFTERKRSTQCPHCEWRGGWEIAMQDADADDPKLQIFIEASLTGDKHSNVGVVCPNCGHFASVATYKIREFLKNKESAHE